MPSKDDSQVKSVQKERLLSAQEREALKVISTEKELHGQRAIALLAIDEGATQKQAAQQSGLTTGQVKYWLGKFRQVRMEIFPEQVLQVNQFALDQEPSDQVIEKKIQSEKARQTKKKKGKKPKDKKAKKKKGKDKAKKQGVKKTKKNTK